VVCELKILCLVLRENKKLGTTGLHHAATECEPFGGTLSAGQKNSCTVKKGQNLNLNSDVRPSIHSLSLSLSSIPSPFYTSAPEIIEQFFM
jgi:hypothetical protein